MNKRSLAANISYVRLAIFLAAVLAVFVLIYMLISANYRKGDIPTGIASKHFPEVRLGAKAAYVYDIRTGKVIYAKNENTRMPLASLTKIMSALVAEDISPMQRTVVISPDALKAEGDSGLLQDERWSLGKLLDFSLITSSNDGIRAVALALGSVPRANASSDEIINSFVMQMNHKAGELGLKNTYFWNETGLDVTNAQGEEIRGGAYGTAKDVGTLLEYALKNHPELFEATREDSTVVSSLDNLQHLAKNTNNATGDIPGLLISKTGFTDEAGGNLAFVFDPELGQPIAVSILGSTEKGRFDDARILVKATLLYINQN